MLILPGLIDSAIVPPSPDYVGYNKSDNSVSVGLKMDFALWQRSSRLEQLELLADNIRLSLDRIESRYLGREDRERLHLIVDEVQALLARTMG